MRNIYNTTQKDLILKCIKEHMEFKIKDIYEALDGKVGLTTIYRLVDKLTNDGRLTKITFGDETIYQYLDECENDNHFYLKCDKCGRLIHVDCDCISDIKKHIIKDHNFSLSNDHLIINGLCSKCKED